MIEQLLNWNRYWCPRGERIYFSENHFMYDPEGFFGQNNHLVTFPKIAHIPCLVLLGEPGSGKSSALKFQEEFTRSTQNRTLFFDLGTHSSEKVLIDDLFNHDEITFWKNDNYTLHLFLDSLDEGMLSIKTISKLLSARLKTLPIERLFIRICCRSGAWPESLETELSDLYEKENCQIFNLAPLRKVDIQEYASLYLPDPASFITAIIEKNAVPLATKPITLKLLTNIYRKGGEFPGTQAELYKQGCKLLCDETNLSRKAAGFTGEFDSEKRMKMAGRIATLSIFSNKLEIWNGNDLGIIPAECLTKDSITTSEERASFPIPYDRVTTETLTTGLFSAKGANIMGWAHQTFAEFLAAWFLLEEKIPLPQIFNLITHPEASEKKIIPQLTETVGWLASMNLEIFREVTRYDPEVLFLSDVASTNEFDRQRLVEILLKLYDEEKIIDDQLYQRHLYQKLNHTNLASQLQPYIANKKKNPIVRRVAIGIAEACNRQELLSTILDVVMDETELHHTRVNAAYAIIRIGDAQAKIQLKKFINNYDNDPDEQLKGCALMATWPDLLTIDELISALEVPKNGSFYGSYQGFLSHNPILLLKTDDLIPSLTWVKNLPARNRLESSFNKMIDTVYEKAWEHLEVPGIIAVFIDVILCKLAYYDHIFSQDPKNSSFGKNETKRRFLLEAILPIVSDPSNESLLYFYIHNIFLIAEDIPWLIELFLKEPDRIKQKALAYIINRLYRSDSPEYFELIYQASEENPVLFEQIKSRLISIELYSPLAEIERDSHLRQLEYEEEKKNLLLVPPPSVRVQELLNEFETGNTSAWWHLNLELTLTPQRNDYYNETHSDITTLPGWQDADEKTKTRIIIAAHKYLTEGNPETEKWYGKGILFRPAHAGYRAFRLLLRFIPDMLDFSKEVWGKWLPAIIEYCAWDINDNLKDYRTLLELAYKKIPEDLIKQVLDQIEIQNKHSELLTFTERDISFWDDRIADALFQKSKDKALKPNFVGSLLDKLIEHNYPDAVDFAKSLIQLHSSEIENEKEKAKQAACSLILYSKPLDWTIICNVFNQNPQYGRDVMFSLLPKVSYHNPRFTEQLSEKDLADFYIWMENNFPHKDYDITLGSGFVGLNERIGELRDSFLQQLKQRGTPESVQEIKRIKETFPELSWLKWTELNARKIAQRMLWAPLSPQELLKLLSDKDRKLRLIQSGAHLIEVVIESLERFQEKLLGETPFVNFLWDKVEKKTSKDTPAINSAKESFKPKDENHLSDLIKIHLEYDLAERKILINREVQIRRRPGTTKSEHTDIKIDAFSEDNSKDVITVIIEVKGCWNRELKEAMETQLANRYLKEYKSSFGIYVVGAYYCSQWDNDYKKNDCNNNFASISELSEFLQKQADSLSNQGIMIKPFILDAALR